MPDYQKILMRTYTNPQIINITFVPKGAVVVFCVPMSRGYTTVEGVQNRVAFIQSVQIEDNGLPDYVVSNCIIV